MNALDKVLVTTDSSHQSHAGIAFAGALARRLGARLTLLYVVEDHLPPLLASPEYQRHEILEEHRRRAADKLAQVASEQLPDTAVETRAVVGVAVKEIVREAEEGGCGLIVMASHGYGPIAQLLLGSTTERVLHSTTVPVVVVPSREG